MKKMNTHIIIFMMFGPLIGPVVLLLLFLWSSLFDMPRDENLEWVFGFIVTYVAGIIPACATGLVSGLLYKKTISDKKQEIVIINTIGCVIAGATFSFIFFFLLSMTKFGFGHFGLAIFTAGIGACSSFFCSMRIAFLFLKENNLE